MDDRLLLDRIKEVWFKDGEEEILFVGATNAYHYQAIGDCCSESWFADVIGLDALLAGPVLIVRTIEMPDYNVSDGRGRQQEDQAYGVELVTTGGVCTIVYRNSSNGYYGGKCEFVDEHTIQASRVLTFEDWRRLTEDYNG